MDYHSIHGQDVSNFSSSPSPHRMPTISAAQALQDLKTSPTRCISTGLSLLDCALQNRDTVEDLPGGVSRGKVTEIYGPPGVGKTALGMQLATNVLRAGDGVIWVDAAHPLPGPRFSHILKPSPPASASEAPPSNTISDLLLNFTHFSTPTLAHLIALLSHPTSSFPPSITSLIIIDSLSTLFSCAFPRTADATSTPKKSGILNNPSARKFPILQYLLNSLTRLAATRNIAIVILSQCVTKMRPGAGAVLVPAINTPVWDQGLGCRIAIFRDWGWERDGDNKGSVEVRFAEIMKAEGVTASGRGRLVPFEISESGIFPLSLPALQSPNKAIPLPQNPIASTPITLPQKRKFSATDLEIPDSEGEDDEDYGWGDEDEDAVPEMPPQWQGSEDILVPAEGELEEEEEQEEEVISEVDERVPEIEDSEDELAIGQ